MATVSQKNNSEPNMYERMHDTGISEQWVSDCAADVQDSLMGVASYLHEAPERNSLLHSFYRESVDLMYLQQRAQRDSATTKSCMFAAMHAITLCAEVAQPGTKIIAFHRGALPPVQIQQGAIKNAVVSVSELCQALLMSIILRDKNYQQRLLAIDPDCLTPSGVTVAPFVRTWLEALRSWLKQEFDGCSQYAMQLMRETDPTDSNLGPALAPWRNVAAMIYSPAAELLGYLALNDRARFEKALIESIKAHQQYYTLGEDHAGGGGSPAAYEGFMALAPTAMAALAWDIGWKTQVIHSDYVPTALVQNSV
jgi:hypothetical protein